MFGKHFESMYEGSMVGAGAMVYAVWGFVISKQRPDKTLGSQVHLNPKLLAFILGEGEADIVKAIGYLTAPDSKSTTKTAGGRRLVKVGEFDYQVVNGAKYRWIQDEDTRREQNRVAQAKWREVHKGEAKKPKGKRLRASPYGTPLKGESAYCAEQERLAREEDAASAAQGESIPQ